MPDSSDIDQALIARLGADTTLLGYMPNGVYWDEAPAHNPPTAPMLRFVIVSLVDQADVQMLGARSHEDTLYLVKAVALSTTNPNIKAAAARLDALLDGQTLTVAGYNHMVMHRQARIRITEVDDVDPSIRWFHRGGHYRVMQSL